MGLRCLLGHDFGEPETERERNEEGNEVVVTVREVKTCQRCGEKQVVSENKEIKSIDQLRESATGETAPHDTASTGPGPAAPTATDDEPAGAGFGTEEPTVDGTTADESSTTNAGDQWTADELDIGEPASEPEAEAEPAHETESVTDTDDDVDRGVAEIIESAEKDDEMLQTESESAESETSESETEASEDEAPVHPAERGSDEDDAEEEESAPADEDAVILDDESPPEEGREQWDETAHPEEVPGRDNSAAEPRSPDDEDAIIMGDDEGFEESEPEPEPVREQPSTEQPSTEQPTSDQPTSEQASSEQPTAVEDEDAEIMGSEPAEPETGETDVGETTEEAAAEVSEPRETTDEGHMPWPEAPGEDEGHDAEAPDGQPADVEFGGGLTPEQPENERNGAETTTDQSASSSEEPDAEAEPSASDNSRSTPEPNINLEQSSREAGLEYYCSECGLTRDVGNSSMRAGDICPECRKGYITERQKTE